MNFLSKRKVIAATIFTISMYSLYAFSSKNQNLLSTILVYLLLTGLSYVIITFDEKFNNLNKDFEAQKSEMKMEKEILERKIQERNMEVREMEADKINQLYRLAEFGRISSGIFHDLINPLTAISLNLEQISCQEDFRLERTRVCLKEALIASSKMEELIGSLKKSIKKEAAEKIFTFYSVIENVLKLLSYQARKAGINIRLVGDKKVSYYGDSLKFSQVITNLIINAIDSCRQANKQGDLINIRIKRHKEWGIIKISDCGEGIKSENMNKIFQPFFTTKENGGLGLGLSSSKSIIEKDFKGSIKVFSNINERTVFIIKLPLH